MKNFKLAMMACGLVAGAALTSCSNEGIVDAPKNEGTTTIESMLVKAPEMIAYSGNHTWTSYGEATRAEEEGKKDYTYTYTSRNDVEVNLCLNAENTDTSDHVYNDENNEETTVAQTWDYIASHLSIHVRTATDVEVFLPIGKTYYCDRDDLMIVENHKDGNYEYDRDKEYPHEMTMNIGENPVTLKVDYGEEGITIKTQGINEEVIEYCAENFEDGITFEIWNYYNDPEDGHALVESRDALQRILNGATVSFDADAVDYYVNAFDNKTGYNNTDPDSNSTERVEGDGSICNLCCTVVPVEDIIEEFDDPVEGLWFNGSPFNKIYKHKVPVQKDEEEENENSDNIEE